LPIEYKDRAILFSQIKKMQNELRMLSFSISVMCEIPVDEKKDMNELEYFDS
jgi:hypothetical protein